ncbi:hypothetical protein [Elioraea tepidiphila]|jgi:hypothetical protein|uniref:hypothetical protein n=1 Tax=Elioraea tepidiphila TaxID=457934 RepID=UPI002FDAF491
MIRVLLLLGLAVLAACARPQPAERADASIEAACRAEAERMMMTRTRADRPRLDDLESRFGGGGFEAQRIRTTELLDRDRLYRECLGRASAGQAPAATPAPTAPVQVRQ